MAPASLELLPQPFAWIEIPEGKVVMTGTVLALIPSGQVQAYIVPTFMIAKYPTTNAQYSKFMEAGGYSERKWWNPHAWGMLRRGRPIWSNEERDWVTGPQTALEPTEWGNSELNQPDHPVVGLSYYEAAACCRWLGEITGEPITLPSEPQWQRAAQGDTNWAYPWGDAFDSLRCYQIPGKTCAVTEYEGKSDSPFGIVDMFGNCSEWCDSDGVMRSGKLNSCGYRTNSYTAKPEYGFRIARATRFPRIAV